MKLRHVLLLFLLGIAVGIVAATSLSSARGANGQNGYPQGGSIVALGYNLDDQTAVFRATPVASADSSTLSAGTLSTLTNLTVAGKPNISVTPLFTSPGATVCVRLVSTNERPGAAVWVDGISPLVTFTASFFDQDGSGNYLPAEGSYLFDSYGGSNARVWVRAGPSAGTVTFKAGTY